MVQVLKSLPVQPHGWVDDRVGSLDDAAVARMPGAARSLVLTMDVITPIVDDPHAFGAIAAANSLSDVYAMGGRAELALTFIGMPVEVLAPGTLDAVLAGVHDACGRAGCAIVGGHTMKDSEPKCGLSVVGSVDPDAVWSQRFAQAGDALLLTKPIGTGLVSQSVRAGSHDPAALEAATTHMMALNDVACAVGREVGATACTDVTGFGLLGHLKNLVEASGVVAELEAAAVPKLPGVVDLAAKGCVPGGSRRNLTYAGPVTHFDDAIGEALQLVLADAQTSGGLLLSVPEAEAARALDLLRERGVTASARIGRIVEAGTPAIRVA